MLKVSTFELMATNKTELFRVRIDKGRKARATKIFNRIGLTPAQAVNVFFAKVEATGGIPFDLRPSETDELLADPEFVAHLKKMKAGKVRYTELKDLPE